jgi:hypothetical protein
VENTRNLSWKAPCSEFNGKMLDDRRRTSTRQIWQYQFVAAKGAPVQHEENDLAQPDAEPYTLDAIACQLANGHAVKLAAGLWSRWRTHEEWVSGITPEPYFAIRVYCTEDTLPKRMVWAEEFCVETDFHLRDFEKIWQWLGELCQSRQVFEFDDLTGFLDHLCDELIRFSTAESDAVEHIKHLPEISDPEAFDKVDDSVFNDQNDAQNEDT